MPQVQRRRPLRQAAFVEEFSICLVREERARFKAKPIDCSRKCFLAFRGAFQRLDREHFAVICLDSKNNPIGFNIVAVGTLSESVVHPREVFKCCVLQNASGVIFAHNHPSGDPTPSTQDKVVTERLVAAADILGIRALDHIVFGAGKYFSFADEGLLRHSSS